MYVQFSSSLKCTSCKIMKAVLKSSKRYFRRAAFDLGNSENPLVTITKDILAIILMRMMASMWSRCSL